MLWSINNSKSVSCIFIESSVEYVQNGNIVEPSNPDQSPHTIVSQQFSALENKLPQGSDSEFETEQSFLKTLVYFEGVEEHLEDEEFRASIRKNTNYLVCKRNV